MGEGGEGGGQLTFRLSGLERKGLGSLTEARELLLLLRRLGDGASACAQDPRSGLRGSCLQPATGLFCLVLFNFIGGRGVGRGWHYFPLNPVCAFDRLRNSICFSSSPSLGPDHHRREIRIHGGTLRLERYVNTQKTEAPASVRGILMRYVQPPSPSFPARGPDVPIRQVRPWSQASLSIARQMQSTRLVF